MEQRNEQRECQFCHEVHDRVVVPTVHLNGTSAGSLHDGLHKAVDALRDAQRAMVEAAPNGRDYYVQGNHMVHTAMLQHERRCTDLNRILTELEEMRDHVAAVMAFEAERRRVR